MLITFKGQNQKTKTMTIKFYRRTVYGNTLNYIVDETLAKYYELLTGEKTLTDSNAGILKLAFNIDFKEVLPPKK